MKAFLSALILAAAPAAAQQQDCGPRDVVTATLAAKYGESRVAGGLDDRGPLMEVFASTETGTWTITLTRPNGVTCLIASGQGFEALSAPLPPQGDDT